MSKFLIKLGEFKKTLLRTTSKGLGKLAVVIIPHIKCFSISNKNKKAKCECSRKNSLHYLILLFLYAIKAN